MKYFATLALLIANTLLGGCSALSPTIQGGPISGTVLDEATQKPIEGVLVEAWWYGRESAIVDSGHSVCLHTARTYTDAEGKFFFEQWSILRPMNPLQAVIEQGNTFGFYKKGYELAYGGTRGEGMFFKPKPVTYMKPFTGTNEERYYKLRMDRSKGYPCSKEKEGFGKALLDEANAIELTPEERKRVWKKLDPGSFQNLPPLKAK